MDYLSSLRIFYGIRCDRIIGMHLAWIIKNLRKKVPLGLIIFVVQLQGLGFKDRIPVPFDGNRQRLRIIHGFLPKANNITFYTDLI